jgi:predicted Zn-dependent peptidase
MYTTTLENNIKIVTETMPSVRSVSICILVAVSPRQDPENRGGLAHLVEHMLFQGTSSRDALQIARLIDLAGGQIGAFTTRDYTCYYATVLDDHSPYAIDLLGDVFLNAIFPETRLEREKDAILYEIASSYDIPSEHVNTLLKGFAWASHPLGAPVAGTTTSVMGLTREDVIYFMHEHYTPDRIIVTAAGNLIHDDFVAQIRDAFWRMLGEKATSNKVLFPTYHGGCVIEYRPISQVYFALGIRTLPYAHVDRYGIHILSNILGGGVSSRLFRCLREAQGWVYHIESDYHAYQDDGMLVIEGATTPENLLPVLELILLKVRNLQNGSEPIDEEELWKAKLQIQAQHHLAGESTATRVSRLATQVYYFGHPIPVAEIFSQLEALEHPSQLHLMIQNAFPDLKAQTTIAIIGPEASDYDAERVEKLLVHL